MADRRSKIQTPMAKGLATPAPATASGPTGCRPVLNSGGHVFGYHDNLKVDKDSRVLAPMQDVIKKGE